MLEIDVMWLLLGLVTGCDLYNDVDDAQKKLKKVLKVRRKSSSNQVHVYTCSTFGFRRWITKEVESNSGKLKLL